MEKDVPGPLITLTTDFGLVDHYAGTMRGVLLSLSPKARLVDISHEIAPFSVWAGAYAISQAAPYFPPETVHVVVVDPGVGTERKGVLVRASGQSFVAPDNGVLSLIAARDAQAIFHSIEDRKWWLPSLSATFHGRDIFAPVAAAIANGDAKPGDIGPELAGVAMLERLFAVEQEPGIWHGRVLSRDRFGNLITNFEASRFRGAAVNLAIDGHSVQQYRFTFGEALPHEVFYYFGSSGFIEVGMNQQSAADLIRAKPGDAVRLTAVHA